ncbi:multi-sensor hybrid histidine kinase [Opitutus terrae PB90-1]|uniref:histidine kinase n=2 Tax=Opitutus terrae TaxID=107709 RepID=B1ZPX8_OPITP|nr:multi-sensor hybrid histidine kinase [Opitutus terrae PB90-1]
MRYGMSIRAVSPMSGQLPHPTIAATVRATLSRVGRTLTHTSPVRLLLLICVTIAVTHSLTMLSLHPWHAILPGWAHSLVESVLLVIVLFPALYFFSFRPLIAQVSECQRAEAIMRESEHKYRQLFECLGDAALLFDSAMGRVIDANHEAERMFGRPRAQIVGKRCDAFFPSEKAQEYRQRMTPRVGGATANLEAEVRTSDGRVLPVHISTAALTLFGRDLVVGLFRDITEFKTLHGELLRAQRLECVGALASGIAHDLSNVLVPVVFATDILRRAPREEQEQALLDTIHSSAGRAIQIARQIIAFVRGGESRRTELQLRDVLHETAEMARVVFPKSIRIREDLPEDLWPVRADAAQMAQVLMNLAVNARDAMPDGGELQFAAGNLAECDLARNGISGARPGPYAVFSVADTGSGIPAEHRDQIFDPFFTTKPAGQGTGLGLAITRDIVTSHDGFIQLISQSGHGTKFRIFLPAIAASEAEPLQRQGSALPAGQGELALVVDDESTVLEMTCLALEKAGYEVLRASDGAEALAAAAGHGAGLKVAVVDTVMPFLGSHAVIQALHEVNPSLSIIQTSASIGAARNGDRAASMPHAFLPKPFLVEQLLVAVHEALQAQRLRGNGK